MKIKNYKQIIAAFIVISSLLLGQGVLAATVFLSPSSSSYFQNKSFSVTVYVSSDKQSLNAVSGNLTFPNDKLEVVSVSKSGSIFNFWVQEPSFSNASGKISFEGVVLNPGFQGNSGKLISINFKTKKSGSAKVAFSAASVLANDGKGTNILSGTGGATFSIKEVVEEEKPETVTEPKKDTKPVTEPEVKPSSLAAPVIISDSHPDSNSWYSTTTAVFNWRLPSGVKAVSLLVSDNAQSQPAVEYEPAISSKEIKDLDDGTWYLHASFKYDKGVSAVTHFPIKIDTVSPENLAVSPIAATEENKDTLQFLLSAEDKLSGLAYYEISFDEQSPMRWGLEQGNVITAPALSAGKHQVKIKAYDLAGNSAEVAYEFEIASAGVPLINQYPSTLSSEESFTLAGRSLPDSQVQLNLRRAGGEELVYIVPTDKAGGFNFKLERLAVGQYSFYAKSLSIEGASPVTEIYNFSVESVPDYSSAYLIALIISLLANAILAALLWRARRQKTSLRRSLKNVYQSTKPKVVRRRIVKK